MKAIFKRRRSEKECIGAGRVSKLQIFISKKTGKAMTDFQMTKNKDRILVAVSGGKDSLSLLKILHYRKQFIPIDYELLALHIRSDYRCSGCVHIDQLEDFFKSNGYAYRIEDMKIKKQDKEKVSCFWCSWNRRKVIFETASKLGFNKVAFGHHKDDVVETILLNMFFQGEVSAMVPKLDFFSGKLQVIRPFFYVEEEELVRFARQSNFPKQQCLCPNSNISKRKLIKDIIKNFQKECPDIKTNIMRSLTRINKDYLINPPKKGAVGKFRNPIKKFLLNARTF